MTASFVHPDYALRHEGAERAASLAQAFKEHVGPALRRLSRSLSLLAGNGANTAEFERQRWSAAMDGESIMADIRFAMKQSAPNRLASC